MALRRGHELRRRDRLRQVVATALVVLLAGVSLQAIVLRRADIREQIADKRKSQEREEQEKRRSQGLTPQGIAPGQRTSKTPGGATITKPELPIDDLAEKIAFIGHREWPSGVLHLMNPDGTGVVNLENEDRFDDEDPDWSPDGMNIVLRTFADNTDLFIVNLDGTTKLRLTENAEHESGPSWSPDGKLITFSQRLSESPPTPDQADIRVIAADGSDDSVSTNLTETEDVDEYGSAWSPSGDLIAYAATGPGATGSPAPGIFVMNPDGSGSRRLTSGQDVEPAWSPDGSQIAFTRYDTSSGTPSEIYVVDADGTGLRRLTQTADAFEYTPDWSPDGQTIVFTKDPDGRDETAADPYAEAVVYSATRQKAPGRQSAIYKMRPDGSGAEALTAYETGDRSPVFSP